MTLLTHIVRIFIGLLIITSSYAYSFNVSRPVSRTRIRYAFAAITSNGTVVAWGNPEYGGDTTPVGSKLKASDVVTVYSTESAFAALTETGQVITWGNSSSGGNSSSVRQHLEAGVTAVFSSSHAFAALSDFGSVTTWGSGMHGGDSRVVENDVGYGVSTIVAAESAFAALKDEGTVVTWGNQYHGGDSTMVDTFGAVEVVAASFSFAARKMDGSVVSWGLDGNTSNVMSDIASDVVSVHSTSRAFAALKLDGTVICWGHSDYGGSPSPAVINLLKNITFVYSNDHAFAAVHSSGRVVTWGSDSFGGNSSAVSYQLEKDVTAVYSTRTAFAAVKANGQVVTWGDPSGGGDSSAVSSQLSSGILSVWPSESSFAAVVSSGNIVWWGHEPPSGIPFSSVTSELTSAVCSVHVNSDSFAVVLQTRQIVTWGGLNTGGDSSALNGTHGTNVVTVFGAERPGDISNPCIVYPTQTPTATPSYFPTVYIPTPDEVALCDLSKQFSNPMRELYGWECDTETGRPVIPICDRYEEGYEYYSYISSWTGITCNAEEFVTEVAVSGFGFEGAIPSSLGYMPYLEYLDMSGNLFSGTIPQSLWVNASGLLKLALANNSLTGSLPEFYGNFSSIVDLKLARNSLSGSIPFSLFQGMPNLIGLYLDGNFITGSIPASVGNATYLEQLDLTWNNLSGRVPESLCNLKYLFTLLIAAGNSLGCYQQCLHDYISSNPEMNQDVTIFLELCTQSPTALPSGFPTFTPSVYIPTPDEVALCDLSKQFSNPMRELYGWECDTETGRPVIPICDRYEEGYEYYSYISSWTGITCNAEEFVTEVAVSGFGFEGAIPSSLGYMPYLEYLDMSGNLFSGTIPQSLWVNASGLLKLALANNSLTGSLPEFYGNFSSIVDLKLARNSLSGSIPFSLFQGMPNLIGLYLDGNFITGSIPASVGNATYLEQLDLTWNNLSGRVPESLCNLKYLFTLLIAAGNSLGCYQQCLHDYISSNPEMNQDVTIFLELCTQSPTALPSGFPTFTPSVYIPTPDEVALCDLSKQFSNPMRELYGWECDTETGRPVIPICDRYEEGYEYYSYISSWTGITCNAEEFVTEVAVSGFGFEGAIPSSLGYMPYLEYLDMSGNLFSGTIPQALVNNVTGLSVLDLSGNQLSGMFPHTFDASPSMMVLRLSANSLSGTIPLNLGDHMVNLEYLYLDMNLLIGSIPYTFGSMHQLRDLVLNDNLLSGSIPSFLCELSHLSLFKAYNNFFSCIPECFLVTPGNRSKEIIVNTSTLCTEAPSSAPSLQSSALTLSPTVMSTLYFVADPEEHLEEAINGSIHEDDAFIIYETSNSALSYVAAQESWKEFVSNFLVTEFDFEYYFIEVWSVVVNYGAEDFISAHFSCDDVTVLQEIVAALVNESIYSGTCGDVIWSTSAGGYLCIGCPLVDTVAFNSTARTHCVTPSNEVVLFAPDSTCQEDPDHLQLIASAINFFGRQETGPTVPFINSVSVVTGRVSVSVYVNITLSAVSDGGTLYCAAFISSFTLTTPDEVKVATTSVMHVLDSTANSDILEVELEIVDLVPLTDYSVYCVAEDSQSEFLDGTSLDDTLRTRTEVSTLCCRLVLIDSYPPAVILTRSLSTEQLVSSRNSFIFSYRLIRAPPPGSELVVTPVFTYYNSSSNSNVSLSGIRAFPASITFLSSYTGRYLYGSFTVTGDIFGRYYVGLNLSGTAASMYEGEVGAFVLSTVFESPPIPQLELVRFDSTGRATAVFDNPTDYGVSVNPDIISNSFKCSILLSFVGSQLSECFWVNSSAIRLSFSGSYSSSLLSPGDTVSLRNGAIRSYYCLMLSDIDCDDDVYSTNSFAVAVVHPSVTIPTVRMVVQNMVSVCSPIVLDVSGSTGNAGRSWYSFEFTVSVVSAAPNAAQLSSRNIMQSFLNNLDAIDLSFPIHIDPSMHVAGSYRFGLTLYNYLRPTSGGYRFQTVTVSPSESDIFPPMVFISGRRFREVFASEPLTLYAAATWNTSWLCDGYDFDGYELEYTWDLYRNFVYSGIVSESNDPKAFKVDPYTLRPGATYQFYVTAVVKHPLLQFPLSSRAYATVYVKPGNVFAAIRGGQHRAVPLGVDVVLDASYSVDEGLTPSLLQQYGSDALSFSWKCIIYSPVELYGTSCDGYTTNNSEFTLLSSALNSTYSYQVTVLVVSSYVITPDVARSASASVVIEVRDESSAPAAEISSVFSKFNPNFKLEIDSTLTGSSYSVASWRVADSSTHNALVASNSFLTPLISNFTEGDLLGSGVSFPLSIAAASLTGGVTYTFVLTVNITGTDNYLYSTISLTANLPPTSGSLVVSPTNGTSNMTFSLRAPFWTDDITDYPLLYSFSYIPYPGSNVVLSVKLKSEVPHTLSLISAGLDSYAHQVECVVDVEDFFGSNAIASTNVTVTSGILMSNDRYIDMLTTLKRNQGLAQNTSNFDTFLQVIQHTATSLIAANCSAAPNCAVLHRLPCSYKPHTCGPCVEGYASSSLGDSNVACKLIENDSEMVDTTQVSNDYLQSECVQDDDCLFGVCDAGICVVPSKACLSHVPNVVCSGHGSCLPSVNISQECLESDPYCGVACVCDPGYGGSSCYYTNNELLVFDETMYVICEGLTDILQYNDISTFQFNTLTDALLQAFTPSYIFSDSSTATCLNLLRNISAMITADYSLELSSSSISNFFAIVSLSTELSTLSNESLYTIGSAFESGVSGLLRELSDGELPLDIVTENIKLSVNGDLISSTSNKLYSPPSSSKDQFYGTPLPSLSFSDGGLVNCADYNKYVRLLLSEWSMSTARYNSKLRSDIFQVGSAATSPVIDDTSKRNFSAEKYQVVLHYTEYQEWDPNNTIPGCTVYDSGDSSYRDCPCNVSTFTPFNVTLECYDNNLFCQSSTSKNSRRLARHRNILTSASGYPRRHTQDSYWRELSSRRLDFEYEGSEEDDYTSGTRVASYGALVESVSMDLVDVSSSPEDIDWKASLPTLLGIVSALCMLLFGVFYFLRWDELDRLVLIYSKGRGGGSGAMCGAVSKASFAYDKGFIRVEKAESSDWVQREPVTIKKSPMLRYDNDSTDVLSKNISQSTMNSELSDLAHSRKDSSVRFSYEKISDFFESALPSAELSTHGFIVRMYNAVKDNHDWIRMFTFSSLRLSRTLRYLKLVMDLLLIFFVDTLFYGVLFPDDNTTCRQYSNTTSERCLEQDSYLVYGDKLCSWDEASQVCTLRPPPSDFIFYTVVTLLMTVVTVGPSLIYKYLLEEVCVCRPVMEDIGLSTDYWFPVGFNRAIVQASTAAVLSNPDELEDRHLRFSALGEVLKQKDNHNKANQPFDDWTIQRLQFHDFGTVDEELDFIHQFVEEELWQELHSVPFPWRSHEAYMHHGTYDPVHYKSEVVLSLMGMYPDGTAAPLSLFQRLRYGNARRRLREKVKRSRRDAKNIVKRLSFFDDRSEQIEKDTTLIQYFILEQFSAFERFALRRYFFHFDDLTPDSIGFWYWFGSWLFIITSGLFYIYWVIVWAATHGDVTSVAWTIQIILFLIQDVFITQMIQIYLVCVLAMEIMRPQLKQINHVLNAVAATKIRSDFSNNYRRISIVQHLSGACRAARSLHVSHLPAARLLMKVDDNDILMCRRVRNKKLNMFTAGLVGILTALAVTNVFLHDTFLNICIPTAWSFFLIAHALLERSVGYIYIIALYAIIAFVVFMHFCLIRPPKRLLQYRYGESDLRHKGLARWNRSKKRVWGMLMKDVPAGLEKA